MEKESFEDEEVAELLNRHYVAIKVDREERPDVDHIYMTVCQAMTGQGGWPLTIIMTPDKKPFFAGTYFPKKRRYGRYGLMDILQGLAEKWEEEREGILETAEQVVESLKNYKEGAVKKGSAAETLDDSFGAEAMAKAFSIFDRLFDPQYGGFGDAPKFPTSHNISLLLRYYDVSGNDRALEMAEKTLEAMRRGGIYDHIGFGFARYSTDEKWLVPHFEKMLYDNALLAMTYLEAYQLTGKKMYADTAGQIFTYVLRDMTDEGGAFYSAEDADSEGEEGKFYVWRPEEVKQVLGEEDGERFCELFDITEQGNFEGHGIPNLIREDMGAFARRHGMSEQELEAWVEPMRQKLFDYREKRVHPHKDDKILTAWNGLMIMALARGAKALGREDYAQAAEKAADFILRQLRRDDGRLLARYRDGEAAYPAYLDDYAFLVWGLIELYEAAGKVEYLREAKELNADMIRLFWDEDNGGFYFTGNDTERLFIRPKEIYDGAMPSGNSAALLNLSKLARYTYDAGLSQKTEEQIRTFAVDVEGYPAGHALFVIAVEMAAKPGREAVIAGDPGNPAVQAMLAEVRRRYAPDSLIILHPPGAEGEAVRELCPLAQDKIPIGGRATAYICENFACQSPVTEFAELVELLER